MKIIIIKYLYVKNIDIHFHSNYSKLSKEKMDQIRIELEILTLLSKPNQKANSN